MAAFFARFEILPQISGAESNHVTEEVSTMRHPDEPDTEPCAHGSGWFTIQADGGDVLFGDRLTTTAQWCRECGAVQVGDEWILPDRAATGIPEAAVRAERDTRKTIR